MRILGNIATPLEKHTSKAGNEYWTFRLAENLGREENRTTTWYSVTAFISEVEADLLAKGQFVEVTGRLTPDPFVSKKMLAGVALPDTVDELVKLLKDRKALGVGLTVLASKVEPKEIRSRETQTEP
jgi:hypothetical protein